MNVYVDMLTPKNYQQKKLILFNYSFNNEVKTEMTSRLAKNTKAMFCTKHRPVIRLDLKHTIGFTALISCRFVIGPSVSVEDYIFNVVS